MLNPAYQALLRIQSKISTIRTLEEIKVSPSAIWTLDLRALNQTAKSILELGFRPILTQGYDSTEEQPHLLKVEDVNSLGLFALQEAFIKTLQSAL